MYYLQSRYYNPEWGRFINADTVNGKIGHLLSHNIFAYCFNNPVNMQDSCGNWPSFGQIFDFGKSIVNKAVERLKETVIGIMIVVTSVILVAVQQPEVVQAIVLRGTNRVSSGIKANYRGKVKAGGGKKAANFSPSGSGRSGAFREAKRASGIPVNEQPIMVSPAKDLRQNPIPGRDYFFSNGKVINEHLEHIYPDNPTQNRGPHFNDIHGNHYDYAPKE